MQDLSFRPLIDEEHKYTYAQSNQLKGQTGSIGRLRGDFDSDGYSFHTTWEDHVKPLKTDSFQAEFDDVVNTLRVKKYGLFTTRKDMAETVKKYPESKMDGNYTSEYGFRADTEKFSYLIRCNPTSGDYNFYIYCYLKSSLDNHISKARAGIRFITPSYNNLFKIPDGESVVITSPDGKTQTKPCRYIDEVHAQIGNNLFHICEFAERMKESGKTVEPANKDLQKGKTHRHKDKER